MKLLELWNKYQKSGINGAPIITDEELKILSVKLSEVEEFIKEINPAVLGICLHKDSIDRIIFNRDNF